MFRDLIRGGCLLAGLALAGPAPAADEKPADTAAKPRPDDLVADLGHPAFAVRERASQELWKLGAAARPAVAAAAASPDPEVARRARDLLDKFDWGVFPDTPAKVVEHIREFRSHQPDSQRHAVGELLKLGRPGLVALRAILAHDMPAEPRAALFDALAPRVRREAPLRLFEGNVAEAEALVELNALGPSPIGAADYAAFHFLRGTLPQAVAKMEPARRAGGPTAVPAAVALAHLYRAQGEWARARDAARAIPAPPNALNAPDLTELLYEEEGNWAELARGRNIRHVNNADGLDLTLDRLAGRAREFERRVGEVVKGVEDSTDADRVLEAAHALLLNNRVDEATDLLLDKKLNPGLLFDLLAARMRYKEALALAGGGKGKPGEFDTRRARLLYTLGKRDEAVQLFGRVAEATRAGAGGDPDAGATARHLLRTEVRLGLKDLAADHAGLFLAGEEGRGRPLRFGSETPFEILFDQDATAAESLFGLLREGQTPGENLGALMRRTRDLLAGRAAPAQVDAAVKLLRSREEVPAVNDVVPKSGELPHYLSQQRVARLLALAAVLRAAKREDEAEKAFADAADAARPAGPEDDPAGARSWVFGTSDDCRPWVDYGEYLMDRGRFADAAARLLDGWRRFPDVPTLLHLSGKALLRAGDEAEGKRRQDLAHWVTLGNERGRGRFLEELLRRGAAAPARRETELVLRACWSRDGYFGNVMNQAARASLLNKDFDTAERCIQRSLLVLLKTPYVHFVDPSSYLTVPHAMQTARARGLLAAGKVDEAVAQARACLRVLPGNGDLVIALVPELEKRGRAKEAEELFRATWAVYRKAVADYPDGASARNGAAWLAANCRRELDAALGYAQKAVELDPKPAAYRDTLAEVHFRRGERDKAVEVMAKLVAENPLSRLYKRQLDRYRTGDPAAPLPEDDDDD